MKIAIVNLITRTPSLHRVPQIDSNKDAMIVKLAKEMKALGHDVVLFISDLYRPEENEDIGIEVVYLRTYVRGLPEIPLVPSLVGLLRNRFDVVLMSESFQWATAFAVLARLLSWKKKPTNYVWQELSVHQRMFRSIPSLLFHRVILRYLLNWQIEGYIPRGLRAEEFLVRQGIGREKILRRVSHGVDNNIFFPESMCEPSHRYIFAPARLVADKGIDVLLKAFAMVLERGFDIDLVIQGDGPDWAVYQKIASAMRINERVTFNRGRANHDSMRWLYSNAILTVVASRRDFMLFSVMESMACHTPVIVSDAVDISDEIKKHGGGVVFPVDDYAALAEHICHVIGSYDLRYSLKSETKIASEQYLNRSVALALYSVFGERNKSTDTRP